ncbi:MAG: GIY-YIG nuclease family protein [Patescibacteria group bacterium]
MPGFVYILRDLRKHYYIGSTDNPDRRMYQHGLGHTKTTARMLVPEVVLVQEFPDLAHARKVELRLKRFKRKDFIDKIVKEGFIKLGA